MDSLFVDAINASKGFIKDGNKNRLRAQDIHRIVDTFDRQIEIPRYSRLEDSKEGDPLQAVGLEYRAGPPRRSIVPAASSVPKGKAAWGG
jgi:hypothetical protein